MAVVIAMLFEGFGEFVVSLIAGAIRLVIFEPLLRLGYELIMMTIVIARNTSAIKRKLCNDEVADADGISSLTPAPVFTAAAPEPAPAASEPEPAPTVCAQCGAAANPDDRFCSVCGFKLQ